MFSSPFELISLAITFVISISLHEYAHARASDKLGDPTPKLQGRLTPNPLVHIDLLGFLMIFLINFGRGRPVIINPAYYTHPRRDELLVALAGPCTNLLLATAGIIITQLYISLSGLSTIVMTQDLVVQFWQLFSRINVSLAIFNMLPFPPLDGYRIITYLWPAAQAYVLRYGSQISLVVILLLVLPTPIRESIRSLIHSVGHAVFAGLRFFRGLLFL